MSNDSFCSNDSLTRDLRLIRKRKLENLQNDNQKRAKLAGNGDIQLHQTPTKLMRPLLPLANPNVLEENSKIVERFPSLEEKPLVRPKLILGVYLEFSAFQIDNCILQKGLNFTTNLKV